jgi:hypothetical protein
MMRNKEAARGRSAQPLRMVDLPPIADMPLHRSKQRFVPCASFLRRSTSASRRERLDFRG